MKRTLCTVFLSLGVATNMRSKQRGEKMTCEAAGRLGGLRRAARLSRARLSEIGELGARIRWKRERKTSR